MLLPTSMLSASMLVTTPQETMAGEQFLKELKTQLSAYTNNYLHDYNNVTRQLSDLLLMEAEADNTRMDGVARGLHQRDRRQVMTPDLGALQSGYSQFFGSKTRRNYQTSHKKKKKTTTKPHEDEMPIVLVPQEDETECVSNNQLSSFGFLGFILNIVNAIINVANNLNNNNNSNNNNDNNNNNNDLNVNQVDITETTDNTNTAMAMAGRRVQRLHSMRTEIRGHMRNIEKYQARQRRSSSDLSCQDGDVVDEALLAAVALVDMWKEVLFEEDPLCMAMEFCETSWKLNKFSRLAGMMAEVAGVAAANMLRNFQGVNPNYLIHAAEQGSNGANCTHLYLACHHYNKI